MEMMIVKMNVTREPDLTIFNTTNTLECDTVTFVKQESNLYLTISLFSYNHSLTS